MSNSNGKIYTETVQGVTYGISTDDISYVLGVGSSDVGTLCSHANINQWAKYKPVPISGVAQPTNWQKCVSPPDSNVTPYCYGFKVAKVTSIANIPSMYSSTPWVYQRPRGQATYSEPFRMMDFNGYDHGSTALVEDSNYVIFPSVVEPGYSYRVHFTCDRAQPATPEHDELEWTDFDTLKTCYFGVALANSSGTVVACATNSERAIVSGGSSSLGCDIDVSSLAKGQYRAYPFLSTVIVTQGQTPASGTFYALPFISQKKVKIADFLEITITATYTYEYDGQGGIVDILVEYDITATNISDTNTLVMSNCYSMLRASGKDWDDTNYDSEETASRRTMTNSSPSGTVEIAPGGSYSPRTGFARTTRVNAGYVLAVFGQYHATQTPSPAV